MSQPCNKVIIERNELDTKVLATITTVSMQKYSSVKFIEKP